MRYLFQQIVTAPLDDLRRRPAGQLPGLDALRTLAVLLVVCGHTASSYTEMGGQQTFLTWCARVGWTGVDLFFVLSGYLIGKQLWRELTRDGSIDFWRFFLRRGLRIWPLYFFFLAFVAVALGRGDLPFGRGWSDMVFLTNYVNQGIVMGSWSLCTEEQFYLLAPLVLIVTASRIRSLAGYRRLLWIGIAGLPVLRGVAWWRLTGDFSLHDPLLFKQQLYEPIHSHCDGLLMGLILSNLAAERRGGERQASLTSGLALLVSACLLMFALRAIQREVFNFTGLALVLGVLVTLALRAGTSGGIPQASPFYWLSRLSYGMYLNHAYLHQPLARLTLDFLPGAERFPALHLAVTECLVVALSASFAAITFCLVEHPFLRLRERVIEKSKSVQAVTEKVLRPLEDGERLAAASTP